MEYNKIAAGLVQKCLDKGADQAEVFIQKSKNISIEIRNGDTETIQESSSAGVGLRVIVKNRLAFSHCNDFSDAALDNTVSRVVEFANNTTADENNVLTDDKKITAVEGLYDSEMSKMDINKKIQLTIELEKLAMKDSRITKSDGASFSNGEGEVFLFNSNGLQKSYKSSYYSMGVSVVAEKDEQKSSGYENASRRFFNDFPTLKEIADKAARNAYEMLDPQMVSTQKAPVIFDPDVAYSILGGILQAVNGLSILQSASFLGDKMGQKIASELVTILDDGTRAKGMTSKPFDAEGVPTQKRTIVENGVLKGFLYNAITARRAGVQSTGNAVRNGFRGIPDIGAHCFYMTAGTNTRDEIIQATEKGLLVTGVTGYGINPVSGNFSGGASGFWIEKGKIAFPVKGLTIAGSAFEMFSMIDMVANDLDLNRSMTAPTFRIKSLLIGGK